MNDDWTQDTTDVLHCSMPPQVRAHIEELRDEVGRLRAAEVPLSANVGFVGVAPYKLGGYEVPPSYVYDNDGDTFPSVDSITEEWGDGLIPVALIPVTAWDRT